MSGEKTVILYVDDDADIGDLYADDLENHGYSVLRASNGHDAIKLLECDRIDVVISDILMPNGNGLKVRDRARQLGVPVILATGHADSYDSHIDTNATVLQKPYLVGDLLRALKGYKRQEAV